MSRNKKTLIAILADFSAIAISIILTMVLREHQLLASQTLQFIFFSTVISIGIFYTMGLYRTVLRSIGESAFFLIVACTFGSAVIWSMLYSIVQDFDLRGTIILWTIEYSMLQITAEPKVQATIRKNALSPILLRTVR